MKKRLKNYLLPIVFGLCLILMVTGCSGDPEDSAPEAKEPPSTYGIGESWVVDGQWSLTIHSPTATEERNQFSDKAPAQVVVLDYSYENLGYEGAVQDLFISEMDMKLIDEGKAIASSYPAATAKFAQPAPIGAICNNAQAAFGLDNASSTVTLTIEKYDSDSKKHQATFTLPVS